MRTATWLLVVVTIGAIAHAEPATGTVVVSCNVADASLVIDGVAIAERTPAVLTLPAGPHVIEAHKPPLIAQKKVVEVAGQQQTKLRFDLLPPAPPAPPTGSATPPSSGSARPPSGSAPPPSTGSGAPPSATGSPAPPSATGSPAPPSATGSSSTSPAVPPTSSSAIAPAISGAPTAPPQTTAPAVKAPHCTEGGHPVPCLQGPHCTEGGKPVPCKKELPPPLAPAIAPPPGAGAASSGSKASLEPLHAAGGAATAPAGSGVAGAGSDALALPLHASSVATIEIATTVQSAVAYVDGAPVHAAPCVLELEPGEHIVAVVAAGMISAEALVRVEATGRQRFELTPSKSRKRIDVPAH